MKRLFTRLFLVALPIFGAIPQYAIAQHVKSAREVANFTDPGALEGDQFGASVAIQGNVVVVGAPANLFSGTIGYAYVFVKSQSVWTQAARLSDSLIGDAFGASVAIGANVIAVAAPAGNNASGVVYIFTKPPGGWNGNLTPTAAFNH